LFFDRLGNDRKSIAKKNYIIAKEVMTKLFCGKLSGHLEIDPRKFRVNRTPDIKQASFFILKPMFKQSCLCIICGPGSRGSGGHMIPGGKFIRLAASSKLDWMPWGLGCY